MVPQNSVSTGPERVWNVAGPNWSVQTSRAYMSRVQAILGGRVVVGPWRPHPQVNLAGPVTRNMTCSKGAGAGGKSGQFTATTSVNRVIHHPYRHPDVCYVAAGAQLNGSGHVHVWLTYTR